MGEINNILSIAKILENPKRTFFNNNIQVTEFRVQIPQTRNNMIINIVAWGNLANDVLQFYMTNDYVIIEGYLSLKMERSLKLKNLILNKLEITVLRIYPFLLNYNHSKIKI